MDCIKFAWVNLGWHRWWMSMSGWHQRRKQNKSGCCSDSSERRIWLVVQACVPCVACRSPGKLQREPKAYSVCVFNEEEDLKSDGQTKQVRFVKLATKTFSNLFDSRLLEWSRVMTLLSQGRWGKRWASSWWMAVQTSLSQPPKNCLSPIPVRPQGWTDQ